MDTAAGAPATPPSGRPTGARHEAVAYSSPGELAARVGPRIDEAVGAGDVVVAVLDDETGGELRDLLGAGAHGVDFQDPRQVHSVPGFTTAVRWARTSRRVTSAGGRALIVGQQLTDLPGCGPDYWTRLCIGLEVTMGGLPLTVLCAFLDEASHRTRVVETHPALGPGVEPNPGYRPPHVAVIDHPPPPPPDLGPPAGELEFRADDLAELRHLVAGIAAAGGLAPERVADVVLAVNELASNSVEHGPGTGRLRLWTGDGVLAEVFDRGRMSVPFPGMVLPPPGGVRGRGLWLASELSDVMQVWEDGGTVIRIGWRG